MSTKADITAFAQALCYSLAEQAELDRVFDEELIALGQDPRAWLTQIDVTDTGIEGDPTSDIYQIRASVGRTVVRVLALFFDDRQLSRETESNLLAYDRNWRERRGRPVAFCTEGESDRYVRFYPRPDTTKTGDTLSSLDGSPALIFTDGNPGQVFIPEYFVMPFALLILAREFSRESNHRDEGFAEICKALGMHFLDLLT